MAPVRLNLDRLKHLGDVSEALARGFKPVEQIRLSPAKQFVAGRATLVFSGPHVVDASKDRVDFGFLEERPLLGMTDRIAHAPHDGACAVAWFKPPLNVKYVVDLACCGSLGKLENDPAAWAKEKYTLVPGSGASVSTPWTGEAEQHVATVADAKTADWAFYRLYGSQFWRLVYCEFTVLAKP